MFFAYLFVKMYPEFFLLGKKERIILCILSVLYSAYVIWFPKDNELGNDLAGLVILLTGIGFLMVQGYGMTGKKRMARLLAGSVTVSVMANICGAFWLGEEGWGRTGRHEEAGMVYEATHDSIQMALKAIDGIAAYRYEKKNVPDTLYNDAMLNGLNSGQYYFSVAPEGVSDFFPGELSGQSGRTADRRSGWTFLADEAVFHEVLCRTGRGYPLWIRPCGDRCGAPGRDRDI